jgi:Xaa-Pro aminopeptidase
MKPMVSSHNDCPLLDAPKVKRMKRDDRIARFAKQMAPNSVAIIVANPEQTRSNDTEFSYRQNSDILYLNGFPEPESALVIAKSRGKIQTIMFVRPKDRAREIWTGIRHGVEGAKKTFGADVAHPVSDFDKEVGSLIADADTVYYRFGVNQEFDERFRKLWEPRQKPLVNYADILHEMRLFKGEDELAVMRHAAAISAEAHRQAMLATRPGLKEYQVQAVLEYVFRFHGAAYAAYGSIVAGGNNAVVLHYTNNDQTIENGDLILVDAACEYGGVAGGYASDITRCWPANGKFTPAQREIYELVLKAQEAAIRCIKPGIPLARVHQTAERVMRNGLIKLGILPATATKHNTRKKKASGEGGDKQLTLGDFFMHGTSHWMGLDVHDVGKYATSDGTRTDKGRGKRRVLQPGMVFTVEPGLYFDKNDTRVPEQYRGIGVRIEDDVVVTKDGCENLTAGVPKHPDAIEALMAQR